MNKYPMHVALAMVLLLGSGILVVAYSFSGDPWSSLPSATCLSDGGGCFCEEMRSGWVKQPLNAVSSLLFVLSGLYLILGAPASGTTAMRRSWRTALAVCAITIGVGSAIYHASFTFIGQFLDVAGMHLLCLFIIWYAWRSNGRMLKFSAWGLVCSSMVTLAILWTLPESRRMMFAIMLLVGIACEVYCARRFRYPVRRWLLWAGVAVMAGAYSIWILDNTKILCDPQSLIQGHSIWHLGGAMAVVMLGKYYLSQGVRDERPTS